MQPVPLELARLISQKAADAWLSGTMAERVTPTTKSLLTHWFDEAHVEIRQSLNFHIGQKQALLNTIYLHEVLQADTLLSVYEQIDPALLTRGTVTPSLLTQSKYQHPKFAIKMATGTGKTWVMQAMLVWQYLNARHEQGNFSKNYLIVAPGLIVYERLLDAFLGKMTPDGTRNFATADLCVHEELFLPEAFKDEVFGFVQSSVSDKREIGRKVTADGLIAITNYHLLSGVEDQLDFGDEVEEPVWMMLRDSLPEKSQIQMERSSQALLVVGTRGVDRHVYVDSTGIGRLNLSYVIASQHDQKLHDECSTACQKLLSDLRRSTAQRIAKAAEHSFQHLRAGTEGDPGHVYETDVFNLLRTIFPYSYKLGREGYAYARIRRFSSHHQRQVHTFDLENPPQRLKECRRSAIHLPLICLQM